MKLIRLACAVGVVLVSGGCAPRVPAPQPAPSSSAAAPAAQSAQPIIVIDGRVFVGAPNTIDPAHIDRVEVLKGAAAVDRYGPGAANGVVLITLKQVS